MLKGLITLTFGSFSFGITEFVVMGLLPYFSMDFEVSTATAGHTISAYALGVAFGAIFLLFMRGFALKHILIGVVAFHLITNTLSFLSPSFPFLLLSRFLAGMPHGCFFGVSAIVAQRLAKKGKENIAMSIMTLGQTLSNVVGVPAGTMLAHLFSWHAIFFLLILWSIFVLICIIAILPDTGKIKNEGFKSQFRFMKSPAPWLVLATIFLSSSGMFASLTYISPILTKLGGLALVHVSSILILSGSVMVFANIASGNLSDRFSPGFVAIALLLLSVFSMISLSVLGHITLICIICVCVIAGTSFGVTTPEQVLIVHTSKGGEFLGVAAAQMAFNLGNAIGAYIGGIPFTLKLPVSTLPLFGVGFVILAAICIFCFKCKYEGALNLKNQAF